ncbi:hypothetical protein N7462_008403 [Penicillium macrosclerotiorum]|uniref:uncharacterized protein n=1 Tax=Penicillium macrosclerotiorum TaxID=303699 RepID=UPI002548FF14|nr:uncharacterized protein N7462_008403 [Penicillium macrosclerotiorum]KAJ5675506.1 hypothetical protein N7462_008403 [Penicillium macrosclerotiorum]
MARAAVLPPSPAKRANRTVSRTTLMKSTASTKAKATEPKKRVVSKTTAATKRVPAAVDSDDNSDDTEDELVMMMKQDDEKSARPRGRPPIRPATKATTTKATTTRVKKAAPTPAESHSAREEGPQPEPTKKRVGRPRKNAAPEESAVAKSEVAPRPRGRPKGSTTAKTTPAARKSTRTVAEPESSAVSSETKHIVIATNSTTMRSNILRGPAKKKTVTFQEPSRSDTESDAEEPAAPVVGRRRATGKSAGTGKAGLGAIPMRKAAATTGTRGRKPAAAKKDAPKPLSPKKAKQMARSLSAYASSDGEEDELSAAKDNFMSPVKLIVHSPTKHDSENTGLSSPVRRINLTPKKATSLVDENGEPKLSTPKSVGLGSPVRKINFTPSRSHNAVADSGHLALPAGKSIDFSDSVFMSSPARRPDASPFRFSLRDTPNRDHVFWKDSNTASVSNPSQGPSSPLKMSPRKGHLGASVGQTPSKTSTPFSAKSSFIQSPAKRIASPFKSSLFSSKGTSQSLNSAEGDVSRTIPSAQQYVSPREKDEDELVDKDIEMVEEVARDIFGIQLYSSSRSSSTSPLTKEVSAAEEPLELQPLDGPTEQMEDSEEPLEPEPVYEPSEKMDDTEELGINEQIEQLEEEIRHEPEAEDFETICFNTMEALQKPLTSDLANQEIEDDMEFDMDYSAEESDSEKQDIVEQEVALDNADLEEGQYHSPEPPHMNISQDGPLMQSPLPSEPTLEMIALEEAQYSDSDVIEDMDDQIEDYQHASSLTRYADEEEEPESEQEMDNEEPTLVQSEATFTVLSLPGSPSEPYEAEEIDTPLQKTQSGPLQAPTPPAANVAPIFSPLDNVRPQDRFFDINTEPRMAEDSFMETTQSEIPTPTFHAVSDTPSASDKRKSNFNVDLGFTPLAQQFNSWEANTPSQGRPLRPRRRGIFSLVGPLEKDAENPTPRPSTPKPSTPNSGDVSYPDLSNTPLTTTPPISVEMPLHAESEDISTTPKSTRAAESPVVEEEESLMFYSPIRTDIFEDPESPEVDENLSVSAKARESLSILGPTEDETQKPLPEDEDKENCVSPFILPATPIKRGTDQLRTVHTVSKVPLKGEGEVSPLKLPRKRGLSLESTSPTRSSPRIRKSPSPKRRCSTSRRSTGKMPEIQIPQSPSVTGSPGKTPRRRSSISKQALRGAVVHVDVHTTEGEDASGIFLELLQQMGARCVKSWSWNPRCSLSPVDGEEPKESRVGITHVVYKDGGLRTLEKVKHAGGLVKCVGVGWILDCERENKWLDETPYAVDSSIIPRGGAKRRKSMEPRALSNVNGTLVHVPGPSTPSASGRRCGADRGAVEGFRKITPPTPQPGVPSTPTQQSDRFHIPATPGYNFANLDAIGMSPATPYFLSNRNKLVQQSCPPKQTNRGLFTTTDKPKFSLEEDDEVDSRRQQRARMEAARRKSNFYKPPLRSPLGQ